MYPKPQLSILRMLIYKYNLLVYTYTIWSQWLYKDKLELEKVQWQAARFVRNNYDPMYSVTAMIDQFNWQKLENHIRITLI